MNTTISSKQDEPLLLRINVILESWIRYYNENIFKINDNKTGLLRITSRQQHQAHLPETVILDVKNTNGERVRPGNVLRLVEVNVTKSLT